MKLPSFKFRRKKKDVGPVEASNTGPRPKTNSSGGAKQWLLLHFEKPLLFAVLIIFGLLVYSGVGKLQVQSDQTPEKLSKMATQLETKIKQSSWEEGSYPIPDFSAKITAARSEITPDLYTFKAPGIEKIKTGAKRSEPEFLTANDLRAVGGNGIFWIKDPAAKPAAKVPDKKRGGAKSKTPQQPRRGVAPPTNSVGEGRRWVIITALAPMHEQANNYLEHFADAGGYDPKRDVPEYLAAKIQRLTLSDAGADENIDWKNAQMWGWREFGELESGEANRWAAKAPEPVDPRFVDRALAKPLGPLAFREWGRQATHPEIPLATAKAKKGSFSPKIQTPVLRDNSDPSAGNSKFNIKFSPFDNENTNAENKPQQEEQPDPNAVVKRATHQRVAENRLVRIFDYDVEPGKVYLYRIQLALKNPNFKDLDIDPRFLEDPVRMQARQYRESVWSEPSNAVRVPEDRQVYVEIREENKEADAPIIVMGNVVREIDFDKGEQRTGRVSLQPGEIANQTIADKQLQQGKGRPEINSNNPISTGFALIDWHGGTEPLDGLDGLPAPDDAEETVMTAPAEMLFLDSQGNIFMRTSVGDAKVARNFAQQWDFLVEENDNQKDIENQRVRGDEDPTNLLRNEDKKERKPRNRKEAQRKK